MSTAYADTVLDEGYGASFKWIVFISITFHVLVFLFGGVFLPKWSRSPVRPLPIYTVNLVSFQTALAPSEKINTGKKFMQASNFVPPKAKTKLIPLGKKDAGPAKKTEIKKIKKAPVKTKPLKKVDPGKDIDKALSRIRTKVKKNLAPDKQIEKAITSLVNKRQAGRIAAGTLFGTRNTPLQNEKLNDYAYLLQNVISANWILPPESILRKKGELSAIYIIRIEPSGKIAKAWFEKRSGDRMFDQSVQKAVAKATLRSNFAPLPPEIKRPEEFGLRFTPSGIKHR